MGDSSGGLRSRLRKLRRARCDAPANRCHPYGMAMSQTEGLVFKKMVTRTHSMAVPML